MGRALKQVMSVSQGHEFEVPDHYHGSEVSRGGGEAAEVQGCGATARMGRPGFDQGLGCGGSASPPSGWLLRGRIWDAGLGEEGICWQGGSGRGFSAHS